MAYTEATKKVKQNIDSQSHDANTLLNHTTTTDTETIEWNAPRISDLQSDSVRPGRLFMACLDGLELTNIPIMYAE